MTLLEEDEEEEREREREGESTAGRRLLLGLEREGCCCCCGRRTTRDELGQVDAGGRRPLWTAGRFSQPSLQGGC